MNFCQTDSKKFEKIHEHEETKYYSFTCSHSLLFIFIRCTTRCHSLSFVITPCITLVTRCYSLSFFVTRCHSLSLVVTRCHSMYHSLSFYKRLFIFHLHFSNQIVLHLKSINQESLLSLKSLNKHCIQYFEKIYSVFLRKSVLLVNLDFNI